MERHEQHATLRGRQGPGRPRAARRRPVWLGKRCSSSCTTKTPCLGEPPGPQERVQRHTVEPILETFVPVPFLDVLVPQTVDQLVDVLKILDISSPVEQVIDVPSIISLDSMLQSAVLRVPQLVEELVDVPVVSQADCALKVLVPRGAGTGTCQRCCWSYVVPGRWPDRGLLVEVGHTTRPVDPTGPRAVWKYWARLRWCAPWTSVVDVPVIMQLEFQQFWPIANVKVPQIQFIDILRTF